MRSEGRKQRHRQLIKLIESNPLMTDEEISSALGVSLSTVRLDRVLRFPSCASGCDQWRSMPQAA